MNDGAEQVTSFQEFLFDAYTQYANQRKRVRPSMNEWARYLGVKMTSLDHWMNGNRVPDIANAILLAQRLGPRVYEVLGYPPLYKIIDPKLVYIVVNWEELPIEVQERITGIIEQGREE